MRVEPIDGAAACIAADARRAVAERGLFTLALSGGLTPGPMLRALARERVPWQAVHLFQVDERVAPAGDRERNLTPLCDELLARVAGPPPRLHAMPVDDPDLADAARRYARELEAVAGAPPVLDLVHLGLGGDGHTASLFPGDPALEATDPVALTREHRGRRRMTLTYPALNRARRIVWLVSGAEKADALARLLRADPAIPAGRVRQDRAQVFADAAARGQAS
jgi:6-phosphogluconolactonase